MSTIYSYSEFLVFVAGEYRELTQLDPEYRFGQVYFNCLWEFRPTIANQIRATEMDPFHMREVPPLTHVHVQELWDKLNAEVLGSPEEGK
jgi:hypothetical protein